MTSDGKQTFSESCLVQTAVLRTTKRERKRNKTGKKIQSLDLQFSIFSGNLQCFHFHPASLHQYLLYIFHPFVTVSIRKQARVCFPTEARLFWVWCCSLTTSLTYCSPVPQPDLLLKVVSCLSLLIHPVVNYTLGSAHNNPWISLGQGHGRWLSLEMIPATRPPATQSPSAQAVMGRNIFCVIPQILHTYTIEPINVSFNIPFYVKILC